ncbi:MAG: methyltransferase domain-containing protein [Bradymonadia bacterium]
MDASNAVTEAHAPPILEDIRLKMRRDWDRRAQVDAQYWVAATAEADASSYDASARRDVNELVGHFSGRLELPRSNILDLGCGIGRLSAPLSGLCRSVTGVDVSDKMIAEARRLHGGVSNLDFITTSGADLQPLANGTFDAVFSFSVLPHLPPDVVSCYFTEANRVLREGGWFIYQFWVGPERPAAENDTLTIRVYSEEQLDKLHSDNGFVIDTIMQMDYFDPVLELHPVWILSRKTRRSEAALLFNPMRPAEASETEQNLESGLLVYLAVKHGERGEIHAAEKALAKALELDPKRGEAYIQWAGHRLDAGDLEGAFDLFERMVRVLPDIPVGWLYRAEAALALGKRSLAQASLDQLFSMKDLPGDVKAHGERIQIRIEG